MFRRFSALILLVVAAAPAWAQRLSGSVVPTHYDLAFDVDLARARFSGRETIQVTLAEPTRRIVLHAVDIQFQEVVVAVGGTTQRATVALNAPTQTATFAVARDLPAGAAELRIRYTGILNDKLRGFYLSKANGRNYAVTQLESTDARRAFPSFDEPAFKATFSIALTIDANDTAISNGRLLSDTPGPGPNRHTLTFAESPKMSSYLVAMAVGDFQCLEGEAESIPIRICATPDKKDLGGLALDAAQQILGFYNRYYSIKYPFQKLDVVAVPDFAAGAMENTAAIFYREVDLLADPKTASVSNRKRIWAVLAHEMAHQWFGDLVTMRWWDDLWLNEGFATWMEKRPLAAAKPEWAMELDEVADTQTAMNLDSLASTRAIHSPVETPAEIEGSFDTIAYEKGASVMRMIEGYVGAEVFQRGVNAYLEKHAYGNATSADFWTAMAAASGQPIDRILPTFVNQPGVPLVDVRLDCTADRTHATLSTRRFLIDQAAASRAVPSSPVWQLPVCLKTGDTSSATCQVLAASTATLDVPGRTCAPWVFINSGATAYFRAAYPSSMLRALAPDLGSKLTEAERLSLVGDEWALVRSNVHTIGDYMTLASGLRGEQSDAIVDELTRRLTFAHNYLTTERSRPLFERFVQSLLAPLYEDLGLDAAPGDSDRRRQLRAVVLDALAGIGGDPALAAGARTLLDRALDGTASLDASAANAIVRIAASHGDARLWERLLAASRDAQSPSEQYRYLYGLTAFTDPALIDRSLAFTLTAELRSQDTPGFLSRLIANPAARGRAWTFIKQRWKQLQPKITISLGDVGLVQSLGVFCDSAARDDIRAFFRANPVPAASRALDQTIESINNCSAIREKQTDALTTWLQTR